MAAPLPTSGLVFALDATVASSINTGSPANNDPVDSWTSSAGSNTSISFTQTVGARPTYKTAQTPNSLPAIDFVRGSSQYLAATANLPTDLPDTWTMVCVMYSDGVTTVQKGSLLTFRNAGTEREYIAHQENSGDSLDSIRCRVSTGGQPYVSPCASGEWQVVIYRRTAGAVSVLTNHNIADLTGATQTARSTFDEIDVGGIGSYFDGRIILMAAYERELTFEECHSLAYDLDEWIDNLTSGGTEGAFSTAVVPANGSVVEQTFARPGGVGDWTGYFSFDATKAPTISVTSPLPGGGTAVRAVEVGTVTAAALSGTDLVLTSSLNWPVFGSGNSEGAATITTTDAWLTDRAGSTTGNTAASAVTNNSTLDWPPVIARWARYPYERISGSTYTSEVAAFHIMGVASVAVQDDAAAALGSASAMTRSTTQNTHGGYDWLYRVSCDISGFSAGVNYLRFVSTASYGDAGAVRSSASPSTHDFPQFSSRYTLPIIKDDGSVYTPYYVDSVSGNNGNTGLSVGQAVADIATALSKAETNVDVPEIFLLAGTYNVAFGLTTAYYETLGIPVWIKPNTGVAQASVILANSGGTAYSLDLGSKLVIEGITIKKPASATLAALFTSTAATNADTTFLILVDCIETAASGVDRTTIGALTTNIGVFRWQCDMSEQADGPGRFFGRGNTIDGVKADVLTTAHCAIGNLVTDVDRQGTGAHSDIIQFYSGSWTRGATVGGDMNAIYYNNQCTGVGDATQLVFMDTATDGWKNIAIVNLTTQKIASDASVGKFNGTISHFLVWGWSVDRVTQNLDGDLSAKTLMSFRNSAFPMYQSSGATSTPLYATGANNAYVGANVTPGVRVQNVSRTGLFIDPDTGDMRPHASGSLLNKLTAADRVVLGDANGRVLSTDATAKASIGALQPTPVLTVTYDGASVSDGGTVSEAAGSKDLVMTVGGPTGAVAYISDVALGGTVSGTDASPYTLTSGGTTDDATITTTLAAGAGTVDISWDLSSVFDFDITGSAPAGGGFRSRSRGRGR